MDFETSNLASKKENVKLEWPTEFNAEEIKILEEAAGIYNGMHNLDQFGMGDTGETLAMESEEILKQAQTICTGKGYRLETLIEQVQNEAEKKYTTAA